MLEALGILSVAVTLGCFTAAVIIISAAFRGLNVLFASFPWALAGFILAAGFVLWGLHR